MIFWRFSFRRAPPSFHFFSTNSHYYFRQTHRELRWSIFILVAEIEMSWNRKEIKNDHNFHVDGKPVHFLKLKEKTRIIF